MGRCLHVRTRQFISLNRTEPYLLMCANGDYFSVSVTSLMPAYCARWKDSVHKHCYCSCTIHIADETRFAVFMHFFVVCFDVRARESLNRPNYLRIPELIYFFSPSDDNTAPPLATVPFTAG